MIESPERTNTNVDLTCCNLIRNLCDSSEPRGTLSVDGIDCARVGNSSGKGRHTSGGSSSTSRQNVPNGDVLNERWVKARLSVNSAENGRENFLR
jgi:hypothetical protein